MATGAALALVGMPNAVLWGVIAAVLNFVPYIGGLVNTVILALAAFLAFDDVSRALMAPFVFTVINLDEDRLRPHRLAGADRGISSRIGSIRN